MQATAIIEKKEVLLNSTVRLWLSNEQIQAFKYFQDYYQDLVNMIDGNVFSFKNGHAVVHRDAEGVLRKIDINVISYKKGKDVDKSLDLN